VGRNAAVIPSYCTSRYFPDFHSADKQLHRRIPAHLPRNLKCHKVVRKRLKHILLWMIWGGPTTKNGGTIAKRKTTPSTWKMINLVFGQYDILIGRIWIISVSEAVHLESHFFFRVMVLLTIQTWRWHEKDNVFCSLHLALHLFTFLYSLLSYLFYFRPIFPFLPRSRSFVPSLVFLLLSSGSTFTSSFSILQPLDGLRQLHWVVRFHGEAAKVTTPSCLEFSSRHITIVNSAESISLARSQESDASIFINVNLNLFRSWNYFVTSFIEVWLSHVRAISGKNRWICEASKSIPWLVTLWQIRFSCIM